MNDTSPKIAALVAERYRQMTPDERIAIASSMFDTARAIVESSLPPQSGCSTQPGSYVRRLMYFSHSAEYPSRSYIARARSLPTSTCS